MLFFLSLINKAMDSPYLRGQFDFELIHKLKIKIFYTTHTEVCATTRLSVSSINLVRILGRIDAGLLF